MKEWKWKEKGYFGSYVDTSQTYIGDLANLAVSIIKPKIPKDFFDIKQLTQEDILNLTTINDIPVAIIQKKCQPGENSDEGFFRYK